MVLFAEARRAGAGRAAVALVLDVLEAFPERPPALAVAGLEDVRVADTRRRPGAAGGGGGGGRGGGAGGAPGGAGAGAGAGVRRLSLPSWLFPLICFITY